MQEIKLENNNTNLKVYINGVPNIELMPKEVAECFFTALELEINCFNIEIEKV